VRNDEKINPVLLSLANGQNKQAIEQLYESNLSVGEIKELLEDYRTTYGYPYKEMYKMLENFLYIWGEVRYKNGVEEEKQNALDIEERATRNIMGRDLLCNDIDNE